MIELPPEPDREGSNSKRFASPPCATIARTKRSRSGDRRSVLISTREKRRERKSLGAVRDLAVTGYVFNLALDRHMG